MVNDRLDYEEDSNEEPEFAVFQAKNPDSGDPVEKSTSDVYGIVDKISTLDPTIIFSNLSDRERRFYREERIMAKELHKYLAADEPEEHECNKIGLDMKEFVMSQTEDLCHASIAKDGIFLKTLMKFILGERDTQEDERNVFQKIFGKTKDTEEKT